MCVTCRARALCRFAPPSISVRRKQAETARRTFLAEFGSCGHFLNHDRSTASHADPAWLVVLRTVCNGRSKEVMKPRFDGVNIVNFVDPNKSPVSLDKVSTENRMLMAQGIRDAMIFAKVVQESKTADTTIYSGSNTYTSEGIVTPVNIQRTLSSKQFSFGDNIFTPFCHVGVSCSKLDTYKYSTNTITKL